MTLDDKLRRASEETRSAVSGRPRHPIARVAHRDLIQRFAAAAAGAIAVLVLVGIAGFAFNGPGSMAEPTTAPTLTTVATSPPESATTIAEPSTTIVEPATTAPSDDGLSDLSAVPEGWMDEEEFAESGGTFLLRDSGIALAAFPGPGDGQGSMTIVKHERFDAEFWFSPDQEDPDALSEVFLALEIDPESPDFVVAGIAPLGVTEVTILFGEGEPVFIQRVFQRPVVERSAFVGTIPNTVLEQEGPIRVQLSAQGANGVPMPLPDIHYQGGATANSYEGPITEELFIIPPPLITGSIEADSTPQVGPCQAPEGVEAPPNQGRDITDGEVFPTPQAALQSILAGELNDPWYPQGGFVEIILPDGRFAYAVPFDDDLNNGAVMLIEVVENDAGWTVASWEGTGC